MPLSAFVISLTLKTCCEFIPITVVPCSSRHVSIFLSEKACVHHFHPLTISKTFKKWMNFVARHLKFKSCYLASAVLWISLKYINISRDDFFILPVFSFSIRDRSGSSCLFAELNHIRLEHLNTRKILINMEADPFF